MKFENNIQRISPIILLLALVLAASLVWKCTRSFPENRVGGESMQLIKKPNEQENRINIAQNLSSLTAPGSNQSPSRVNGLRQHLVFDSTLKDEVRYQIPELGIEMHMNRLFAQDLAYEYYSARKPDGSHQFGTVNFYLMSLLSDNRNEASSGDGPIGSLSRNPGTPEEDVAANSDAYFKARAIGYRAEDQFRRFSDSYLYFMRPQGICVIDGGRPLVERQNDLCYIFHTAVPL